MEVPEMKPLRIALLSLALLAAVACERNSATKDDVNNAQAATENRISKMLEDSKKQDASSPGAEIKEKWDVYGKFGTRAVDKVWMEGLITMFTVHAVVKSKDSDDKMEITFEAHDLKEAKVLVDILTSADYRLTCKDIKPLKDGGYLIPNIWSCGGIEKIEVI
jgi:hypothetical protein